VYHCYTETGIVFVVLTVVVPAMLSCMIYFPIFSRILLPCDDTLHWVIRRKRSVLRKTNTTFKRKRSNLQYGKWSCFSYPCNVIKPDCNDKTLFTDIEIVMLILTRQEGEKIYIGDEVVVVVTHNGNDHVRLGIDAPTDKIVLRAELRQKKTDEKAATIVPFDSADSVAPAA